MGDTAKKIKVATTKRLLLVFFSLLVLFNFFAPTFVSYFTSKDSSVYAQEADTETDTEETGKQSCYDPPHDSGGETGGKVGGLGGFSIGMALGGIPGAVVGLVGGSKAGEAAGDATDVIRNVMDDPLKWFVCGVSSMLSQVIDFVNIVVSRLMLFDPTKSTPEAQQAYREECSEAIGGGGSDGKNPQCADSAGIENVTTLKTLWRNVLNIVNILLVVAMLIMVVSTALDIGIFSNYTVKKSMPKIIVGALAANLSWVICSIVITSVNYIGIGIQQVMLQPLTKPDGPVVTTLASVALANGYTAAEAGGNLGIAFNGPILVGIGGLAWVVFAPAIVLLLPVMAAILLAVLIAFCVFLLRRILLIILVIISPIAFMFWAMPGGEGVFKKWWKSFIQLLLIYPYAMVLLGSGIVVSSVIGQVGGGNMSQDGGTGNRLEDHLNVFLMIFAMILPYILLPTAFKAITGVLGTFTGMLNDKGKGLVDRAKKSRDETSKYAMNKKNRQAIKQARRERDWQAGQENGPLAGIKRRRAYGGHGLRNRSANRDLTSAVAAQKSNEYEKKDTEIQKIKLMEEAKSKGWTRNQIIANAEDRAKNGSTKAERNAARDILVDQKDHDAYKRVQDHDLAHSDERAAEADQHVASRFGDVKAFSVGSTAELRDGDGNRRSQEELDPVRTNKHIQATDEVKATQSSSAVAHALTHATPEQQTTIQAGYARIAFDPVLRGKVAQDMPDQIQAGVQQGDLVRAITLGMQGVTPPPAIVNVEQTTLEGASRSIGENHPAAAPIRIELDRREALPTPPPTPPPTP